MRVLLTGASGQLGAYLLDRLADERHEASAWSGKEPASRGGVDLTPVDLTDTKAIDGALARADPEVILHAAAVSTIEGVRLAPFRAQAVNILATARLCAWCQRRGRRLVFTSTDLVFDGATPPYREEDPPSPSTSYGVTKSEAERYVTATPLGLVARLSLLYGPSRSARPSYVNRMTDGLRRGEPQAFFEDEFRTPLDLATAAEILVRLATTDQTGIVHVAGAERLSRFALARRVASALGFDPDLIRANRQADVASAEPRPADVSLDTARVAALMPGLSRPTVEEAVASWSP